MEDPAACGGDDAAWMPTVSDSPSECEDVQLQNVITIEKSKARRDVYFVTRDVRKSVVDP